MQKERPERFRLLLDGSDECYAVGLVRFLVELRTVE